MLQNTKIKILFTGSPPSEAYINSLIPFSNSPLLIPFGFSFPFIVARAYLYLAKEEFFRIARL